MQRHDALTFAAIGSPGKQASNMSVSTRSTLLALLFISMSTTTNAAQPLALGSLVWSEEFNADGLDDSRWSYDIGRGNWGWGNGEVQDYTSSTDNIRIVDGKAVISVQKNNGNAFTSARIRTNNKVEFQYGSVEARIKLPSLNNGFWPAFWLLGSNFDSVGWPACGELDIMEA